MLMHAYICNRYVILFNKLFEMFFIFVFIITIKISIVSEENSNFISMNIIEIKANAFHQNLTFNISV